METKRIDKTKHKNTRQMAWVCLVCSLIYPLAMFTSHAADFIAFAPVFYSFTGGLVVGGYIGVTNVRDGWGDQ